MDSQALVSAIADLARTATGDFAADEMLRQLCTHAATALPVDGAGVMVCRDGHNRFVHATTPLLQPLERLQELLQAGPCADSLLLGRPVAVADLASEGTWPDFMVLAEGLGLGAVVSVPLLSRGRGWGVLDLYRSRTGAWSAEELTAAQVLADVAVSYLVMAHDRDAARTAQRELAHRAMHDELTGLANRALLVDRLEHALVTAARQHCGVAVVFLDLDRFKDVNDTLGHAAGDAVLAQVAGRLSATLRGSDTLARFAGDEFVLVCEGLPDAPAHALSERMAGLAARLLRTLQRPLRVDGVDVVVSASIGVAITTDRLSAQALLSEADTAMYQAKAAGRGRVVVLDHTGTSAAAYARRLEHDLPLAIDREELRVHYQPIVAAGTRRVAAVEALLRWDQPGDGVLPAVAFLDVAVRTGLITTIGRWVLEQTCAQMAEWQATLGDAAPATAFVNLCCLELVDDTLPGVVADTLRRHGLAPGRIGFEVVEEDLNDPAAGDNLRGYHRAGHPLSVDDFGTGYSSLARLLDIPVSVVKIDKSLVAGTPADARRTRLVDSVLLMAGALELDVVAEGVETPEQAAHLTVAGCRYLQGHQLARPQAAADLTALLA